MGTWGDAKAAAGYLTAARNTAKRRKEGYHRSKRSCTRRGTENSAVRHGAHRHAGILAVVGRHEIFTGVARVMLMRPTLANVPHMTSQCCRCRALTAPTQSATAGVLNHQKSHGIDDRIALSSLPPHTHTASPAWRPYSRPFRSCERLHHDSLGGCSCASRV
jgi:hypothetical protein